MSGTLELQKEGNQGTSSASMYRGEGWINRSVVMLFGKEYTPF